jgi:hypothetical protein
MQRESSDGLEPSTPSLKKCGQLMVVVHRPVMAVGGWWMVSGARLSIAS